MATGTEAPPKLPPPPHRHIAALDGMRGCAVLLVLFHHLANSLDYEFKIRHSLLSMGKLGWSGWNRSSCCRGF
jgi:peptidoglycan/LPS O-acetylase OafA/YrhL